jgi:hypothetical protein
VTRTSLQPPQVSIEIRRGQKLVCLIVNEMDTACAVIRLDETRSNSIPQIPCSVLPGPATSTRSSAFGWEVKADAVQA